MVFASTSLSAASPDESVLNAPQTGAVQAAQAIQTVAPASLQSMVEDRSGEPGQIDSNTECLAKAVYHEAGNQVLEGQLAVAQVIINRTHATQFPKTPCAVVNQPGQFFQTSRFSPPVASKRWKIAVAIAHLAQEGHLAQIVPGALFFHAAHARTNWSHRRVLVAQVGGQVFYR